MLRLLAIAVICTQVQAAPDAWLEKAVIHLTVKPVPKRTVSAAKATHIYPADGAMVDFIDATRDAFKTGIRPDDVITHINGKRVKNVEDFESITKTLVGNKPVQLQWLHPTTIQKKRQWKQSMKATFTPIDYGSYVMGELKRKPDRIDPHLVLYVSGIDIAQERLKGGFFDPYMIDNHGVQTVFFKVGWDGEEWTHIESVDIHVGERVIHRDFPRNSVEQKRIGVNASERVLVKLTKEELAYFHNAADAQSIDVQITGTSDKHSFSVSGINLLSVNWIVTGAIMLERKAAPQKR